MKIYVLFIFTILNIITTYSQNRPLFAYFNSEQNLTISPENILDFNERSPQSNILANEELAHESIPIEITNNAAIVDTIPWSKINLGSALMKKKSSRPFPWWIPITVGGAAAVTTGLILLLKDDDPIVPSGPVARNDQFMLPCNMNSSISPLGNDSGEGIRITAISGAPTGWVTFTDQAINISEAAIQNFTLTYTITDLNGAQANAMASIVIEFSAIQLQNPTFQGSPGDIATHQIFTNAVCTGCTVTNANSTPQSNFTWTPGGAFSFELPNVSQPQTILFNFIVTDHCIQTGTAQISVTVRPECKIEPSFTVSNEECDFSDGSIEILISPISDYQFQWSNGLNTATISGLSGGTYRVTVTSISNSACSEVFDIEVLSSTPTITLVDDLYQTVANALITGNVLNNDTGSAMQVTSFEDLDVLEFSIQANGSFRFLADENAEDQYSSVYTVTDICGNTSTAIVIFEVAKLPCEFSAAISTNPADCGRANGSASVIVSPGGPTYEIRWPNGIIGPAASGFAAGSYTLIITNPANNCVLNFNFSISEKPVPNYIQTIATSSATCIGGAQVDLVLNDPTGAGLRLIVTKENMPFFSVNVSNGLIKLGELVNFLPGNYSISVSCAGCPARCAQVVNFTISQVLLILEINDDLANISSNTTWNGNVLNNDFGTGMNVIGFTQPSSGVALVNSNGLAVYTPPPGFSGTISFSYTVRDTCGQEKSATVTINVEAIPCDFTAQFSNIAAECGQMNGSSTIYIMPPGNSYQVSWPDGTQGITNSMLLPGNYIVTVTNTIGACSQMFTTNIQEMPPLNLIQQISANASSCLIDGSIDFTLFNPKSVGIVVEIFLNNEFILLASIPAFGTFTSQIDFLSSGTYSFQALESGSPRRCADNEVVEIGAIALPLILMDDNYTIPFGTVWIGNVLLNDIGTGMQVSGFTHSSHGTVQILSNGVGTFLPNPGFTGTTSFQYFVRDTCKQEQTATVTITVLPSFGNLKQANSTVVTSLEFFQLPQSMAYSAILYPIPEGIPSQQFIGSPGFQNGFRYSIFHKRWLFRTELSYGESVASGAQNQMLYQNNFQTRIGVGWFHDFNGDRITAESGLAYASSKSVVSNALNSTLSRNSDQALYFKTEYQIKLKSGYCIFWEPQLLYFPATGQLSGMLSTGFKYIFE